MSVFLAVTLIALAPFQFGEVPVGGPEAVAGESQTIFPLGIPGRVLLGFPFQGGVEIDINAGYTFEYHIMHNLLVISNDENCYLIDADQNTIMAYHDNDQLEVLEDEIITHIKSEDISQQVSHYKAFEFFHDQLEAAECRSKKIYELEFTLSLAKDSTTEATTEA